VSGGRHQGGSPFTRAWRIVVIAAALALVPVAISFGRMLQQRSDSSLAVRTVEWLRADGARGLVDRVENLYYSLTAPAKGGPALKALPHQTALGAALPPSSGRASHHRRPAIRPPPITPVIRPALAGEGRWRATFAGGGRQPPVLVTSFRPNPAYPQVVAGVAWINHTRTTTWLYPGIQEPAVTMPSRGPEEVPLDRRRQLVATFNSAFQLADSGGGFVDGGHTYAPLRDGVATILRYRDGQVNVISWHGASDAGPGVVYARQNLPLMIEHGKLNPTLSDGADWGATLGNAVLVWRSGIGIDRRGNLIYAAANDQTVGSLARILQRAGAVRAMELDINSYWPSFISYRQPGARGAANLLADMTRTPERYLTPDDRDFFAVYLK
jgi:hypothetical protein